MMYMFLLHELLEREHRETEIGEGCGKVYRPSVGTRGAVELELEPVAITNVDGGCARAATFGKEGRSNGE
jgi:hypothetical protein